MRVVLDTNVLISSLISAEGPPAVVYRAWRAGRFVLLSSESQLEEVRRTLRKPSIAAMIRPHSSGRLINQLRRKAIDVGRLPAVTRSADPDDDKVLAIAEAGAADYLVSGDRLGLLALRRHRGTRIVSPTAFAAILS